ncbi:MAG TPA: CoA transferase [Candidatus Cybelea sp.]|nr:CoA transferase [Candidatus Cybelea sp.]
MTGMLAGIRVLDLTTVLMGPFATQILGDLGADVVRIEGVGADVFRDLPPSRHPGMAGFQLNLHRNKRSVALDLKQPAAITALLRLVETADVFVHNMRPKAIGRLGLDYASLKKRNLAIVYCGAYGFSREGPYGEKAAYDDAIQAASGLAGLFAEADGAPRYVPSVICDKVAGMTVAYAILAALLHRERGGGGQEIEVPMFEANVAFNLIEHLGPFAFEPPLGDFGWKRAMSKNRKPYRTADGYACLLPYSDENWRDFFGFIGQAELATDTRFATYEGRTQNVDALYAVVERAALRHTTAEWMEFCDRVSIPAMPVMNPKRAWDDPHLRATGFLATADHPTEGRYKTIGSPARFLSTPAELRRHAPRQGEHTAEILAEAGMSEADIDVLIRSGAARSAT